MRTEKLHRKKAEFQNNGIRYPGGSATTPFAAIALQIRKVEPGAVSLFRNSMASLPFLVAEPLTHAGYALHLHHDDRLRHVFVLGMTGTGKSSLLKRLFIHDIQAGHGVALIDPHGDLAEEVLNYIPSCRADDTVYFNAADKEFPVGLNLLQAKNKDLIAPSVVSSLRSIWSDSWGPRMEHILFNATASLASLENTSLLGIKRLLADHQYRRWVVSNLDDPELRGFWTYEFGRWNDRFREEAIAPILNKVGAFSARPVIRNIIGQVRSKVEARFMMDNKRIFIANLAKGAIGDEASNLLGSLLTSSFYLAALSRSAVREGDREPFHLIADEFASYVGRDVEKILAETRKYGLGICAAAQHTSQLPVETVDAIYGNVGSVIAFRTGYKDATVLSQVFAGDFSVNRLVELPNHQVVAKLHDRDGHSFAHLGRTIPPQARSTNSADKIIARSRTKYSAPRAFVEEKLQRWYQR